MARKRKNAAPALDKRKLWRDIERQQKKDARAKVKGMRGGVRALAAAQRAAMATAKARCKSERLAARERARNMRAEGLRALAAAVQLERDAARSSCSADIAAARELKDARARAKAELLAEVTYQRQIRAIEKSQRERKRAIPKQKTAAERASESDDEVRTNIPPDLVPLFERVKRGIKGSPRMSRTEAFLLYAETHAAEVLDVLEDKTDALVAEMEERASRSASSLREQFPGLTDKMQAAAEEVARTMAPFSSNPPRKKVTKKLGYFGEPILDWAPSDDRILCANCGTRAALHRGSDGKCPALLAWGKAAPEPSGLDGAAYDAALAAYWGQNSTFYRRIDLPHPSRDNPDEDGRPIAQRVRALVDGYNYFARSPISSSSRAVTLRKRLAQRRAGVASWVDARKEQEARALLSAAIDLLEAPRESNAKRKKPGFIATKAAALAGKRQAAIEKLLRAAVSGQFGPVGDLASKLSDTDISRLADMVSRAPTLMGAGLVTPAILSKLARSNPGPVDPYDAEDAFAEYERLHWGKGAKRKVTRMQMIDPRGVLVALGPIPYLPYLTRKGGDGEIVEYVHTFEKKRPILVKDKSGAWGVAVPQGGAKLKKEGLIG